MEWLVGDREQVTKGRPVCVVETTKAAIEIVSPGEGTLCHLFAAGQEVELGRSVAVVAETPEELAGVDAERAAPAEAAPEPAGPARATKKAVELAARHGVDLALISKPGFITAEDVEAHIASLRTEPPAAGDDLLGGVSAERVSLPASLALDGSVGLLDVDFLASLQRDPEAFRALPEAERLAAYRGAGAAIGEDVRLGARTLIVSSRIVLGDGVVLGDDSTIRCEEAVAVGALTLTGPGFELRCRRAFLGEGGYIGRHVRIGGGGAGDPQALFVAGDLLFMGEEAFVNPCRPVVLGREVFLTMRSVIVTHNIGHSLLEGFENRFAPVVLEDRAQVGIGTVLYAGCRIGAEAIVASNSYVVSDIPPGKLAIGVPAKVAGDASRGLSPERRLQAAERMLAELRELLDQRGHAVSDVDGAPAGFRVEHDGSTSHVLFAERVDAGFEAPAVEGETVVLTLALVGDPPAGCGVLDLLGRRAAGTGGPVFESVREFCRKRGIRFEPGPWRYRGGLV